MAGVAPIYGRRTWDEPTSEGPLGISDVKRSVVHQRSQSRSCGARCGREATRGMAQSNARA
eukprot:1883759-Prymnesium_polylepis.1